MRRAGRLVCLLVLCAAAIARAAGSGEAENSPRIAAIDWGQAQTLIAIGAPPVAMAQIAAYGDWVGRPAVPASVRELGLRAQPNLELLSQLRPDVITITPLYADMRERLAQIAPVEVIGIYDRGGSAWDNTVASTRRLGALAHRRAAAARLIERARTDVAAAAARVPADTRPLLVVQFMDARHVRVFGPDSLLGDVLARMDIPNAWPQDTGAWGFALVPIERLAAADDARIAVIDPMPVGVAEEVAHSVLWQRLPAVRNAPVLHLPAVWSFGGLPSASRFARVLADAYAGADAADAVEPASP